MVAKHAPLIRWLASAYDCEDFGSLKIDISLEKEHWWCIWAFTEARRIGGISVSEHLHTEAVGLVDLRLRESESRLTALGNRLADRVVRLRKISGCGSEHISGRAEMINQLAEGLRAYTRYVTKSESIEKIVGHQCEKVVGWAKI